MGIYEQITDQIIAGLDTAAGEWVCPWRREACATAVLPVNAVTGKRYRGANVLMLWATGLDRGYSSPVWATYKQWSSLGAQVRKGETSTQIAFMDRVQKSQVDTSGEETETSFVVAKAYFVFNSAQVDGWAAPADAVTSVIAGADRHTAADAFLKSQNVPISFGGSKAFYRVDKDEIVMPAFCQFHDAAGFYSTWSHELAHATGHASRLDRQFGRRFGDDAYAVEELVAEISAAFTCAHLGINNAPLQNNIEYLADWLRILKSDKRAIFTAASKAQAATDWLVAHAA